MSKKEKDPNDWREQLMDKYPAIFQGRDDDPYQRGSLIGFGLCVGDGWQVILESLCSQLNQIYRNHGVNCVAAQVKEKFGGLRFYYDIDIDEDRVEVRTAWWKPALTWLMDWRRLWRKPKCTQNIARRYMSLCRNAGVKYLQKKGDKGIDLTPPVYIDMNRYMGEIEGAVAYAENLSYHICESCGSTTDVKTEGPGWIHTLCGVCRKADEAERKKRKD